MVALVNDQERGREGAFHPHSHILNSCCVVSGLLGNSPGNGLTKQLLVPQVALTCTQIWWTTEVGIAFARLEEGYENAMKDYYKKQVAQLKTLITMLIGQLSKGDRQKIMTICTIDVHARDVVAKMIAQKVGAVSPDMFPIPSGQLQDSPWIYTSSE